MEFLKKQSILIATFSPWIDGKRLSTNGNVEPLLDFFVPKTEKTVLIDQPYPGSDILIPRVEVYKKGKLEQISSSSKFFYVLYPLLKPVNFDETHIAFKVRDFLSVVDWSWKDKTVFDFFIGMELINTLAGIFLRKLGRVKKVIYYVFDYSPQRYKQQWFNNLYLWLDRYCAMHADYIWDVSATYQQARIRAGLNPYKSARNIHMPIGLSKGQIVPAPLSHIEPFSLVFMGTLGFLTGPDIAIKAMEQTSRKFPKSILHIIGGGEEDLKRLRSLTQKLKLGKHVDFHGFITGRENISKAMRTFQIALATYPNVAGSPRLYGDANKIHAYLAVGLPVITTKVPPTGRAIVKEGAGVLVEDTPQAVAEAIETIFTNRKLYIQLRKNALKLAKNNSWEKEFNSAFKKMNSE